MSRRVVPTKQAAEVSERRWNEAAIAARYSLLPVGQQVDMLHLMARG